MNVEIGTEFPEKEYIMGFSLQCVFLTPYVQYFLVSIDCSRAVRLSIGSFQVRKSQQGVR
jgi:hypothetical protein